MQSQILFEHLGGDVGKPFTIGRVIAHSHEVGFDLDATNQPAGNASERSGLAAARVPPGVVAAVEVVGAIRARIAAARYRRLCRADRLRALLRSHLKADDMSFDHALGALAVIVLLAYLGYALLKPEKFQ